jgi:hypothetical protein
VADNDDRIEREHRVRQLQDEGDGPEPGSDAWWAERAKRHDLPADQVVVLEHISEFRALWPPCL